MCSRTETTSSTKGCWTELQRLKEALDGAEAVFVGAGAGLSVSAGFPYDGERFHRHFADFEAKYGFHDMYMGGFYPYPTPEEYWAYWSRHIWYNRYQNPSKDTYTRLLKLLGEKEYFVLTTNVDHCFQKAGINKNRLFYTQGDYGLFQCSGPCTQETYDNETAVCRMVEEQVGMRVPTELLPRCPRCGRPLVPNLRSDDTFVEDEGWHAAAWRYASFMRRHRSGRVVYLELGVGYNTPGIIKYPFWRMTAANPQSVYACVNFSQATAPAEIARQAICISGDIHRMFEQW